MESYSGSPGGLWLRDEATCPRALQLHRDQKLLVHEGANKSAFDLHPMVLKGLILLICRMCHDGLDADFEVLTRIDRNHQWHAFIVKTEGAKRTKYLEEKASRPEHALELLHEASARWADQYMTYHGYCVDMKKHFIANQIFKRIAATQLTITIPKKHLKRRALGSSAKTYSSGSTDYTVKALVATDKHDYHDAVWKEPFIARQTLESTHELRVGSNKENLPLPTRKSSAQTYSSGSTDYLVKALVGPDRHEVDALPDTGAKRNFVSQQLVGKLGLMPKVCIKERFRLPTGATVESSGTVNLPFNFLGETEKYLLDCCILPKCTQDLILSQAFLKATGTLTKFTHRVTKSLRRFTSRLRFNLIEDDTCCLQGRFDDIPSIALADTGCDAMLISADFARRHSLEIDTGYEHRRIIEYADGSLDTTAGIVRDSTWQFRRSWDKIPCSFYVLDNLKADIILSSHFIFEHEAFSQFEEDILAANLVPGPDLGDIYNIRLIISHYSSTLEHLEASSIADMNSPSSFSPEATKAERVRRDLIRDAINALPLEQQDQARIDERNRQEIWDGYRQRHCQRNGSTDPTQQVLTVRKQRWFEKGLVWRRFARRTI